MLILSCKSASVRKIINSSTMAQTHSVSALECVLKQSVWVVHYTVKLYLIAVCAQLVSSSMKNWYGVSALIRPNTLKMEFAPNVQSTQSMIKKISVCVKQELIHTLNKAVWRVGQTNSTTSPFSSVIVRFRTSISQAAPVLHKKALLMECVHCVPNIQPSQHRFAHVTLDMYKKRLFVLRYNYSTLKPR